MRLLLIPAVAMLASCVVQNPALNRPYVAARFDSPKPAAAFSSCAAEAMGLAVRQQGGTPYIIRSNDSGVQVARWDFLTTNNGSQAELRSGTVDTGEEAVRGCA